MNLQTAPVASVRNAVHGSGWLFSWPLLTGLFTYFYIYFFYYAKALLRDGDVYWHIAAGQSIFQNRSVPTQDPFSHTMPGAASPNLCWLEPISGAAGISSSPSRRLPLPRRSPY
jgi:hypothetical protein